MAQVDPKSLEYSEDMRANFDAVTGILMKDFQKSFEEARSLIDRFFGIDVDPLERALVMHVDPEQVATDLVGRQAGSDHRWP